MIQKFKDLQAKVMDSPLRPYIRFGMIFARRFGDDECPVKAAAMAFFGFISIFPIILAAVAILATVMAGNTQVLHAFGQFITQFFPGEAGANISHAVSKAVNSIAAGPNATSLGIVAFLSLLWSGRAYFATLAVVLNRIWPEAEPRSFLQQQGVLWGTFLGAGVLGLLSMLSTWLLSGAKTVMDSLPLWFLQGYGIFSVLSHVLSWAFAFLMFWLLYWFLPNVEMHKHKLTLYAALFAVVAWEVGKFAYGRAVGSVIHYEATYGAVAGVVVTLVWIYFASMIVLIAAEGVAAWEEMQGEI